LSAGAAGGGGCGHPTLSVDGHRAHRSRARGERSLALAPPPVQGSLGQQEGGRIGGESLRTGKALGSLAGEEDVPATVQDPPGDEDGIPDAGDDRHPAGAAGGAFHDGRVHLDAALLVQAGARSGIEEGVVLERDTGGLDGLQRGSPFGEDAVADSRGLEAAGRGGSSALLGGKRACAPVYDDGEATHVREPSTGVGVPRGLPIGLATGTGAPALPTELVYAGRAGRRPARGK